MHIIANKVFLSRRK